MIRRLFFFISEAFIGMKRSFLMIFIAQATIFISLVVFGLFLVINMNLGQLSDLISSKLEIRVFLKENLTKKEITHFQSIIQDISGVQQVKLIDKRKAWTQFKQTYHNLKLDKFIDNNPLPHSFSVALANNQQIREISVMLEGFSHYVDDVVYGGVLADRLQKVSRFILLFGWSVVCLLSIATLFIMMNTIKLTIMSRSEEITIMKLVGATDWFIVAPFLMEGLMIGLSASVFAVGLIHASIQLVITKFNLFLPFMPYNLSGKMLIFIYCTVIGWGSLLSSFGALLSTRSTLRNTI